MQTDVTRQDCSPEGHAPCLFATSALQSCRTCPPLTPSPNPSFGRMQTGLDYQVKILGCDHAAVHLDMPIDAPRCDATGLQSNGHAPCLIAIPLLQS